MANINININSIHSYIYQNIVKVTFPKQSLQLLTYNAKPKLILSNELQNQAMQIKKDIASLKEDLLKLNKSDDYI
jgi:hypothetical protein